MKINYESIIERFPWIIETNRKCVLSSDSDGFLCGLLMTNFLNWEVVGFYDNKIVVFEKDYSLENIVFLDVDINRNNIQSIGHHVVLYNNRLKDVPNFNYSSCIQPNLFRNIDGKSNFQRKYPFATIHLLIGILHEANIIKNIPDASIWPLLFTDGVWNNLFGYTENCLEWIDFLRINEKEHILNNLFCENDFSFYQIMLGLNQFLRNRDSFNAKGYYTNKEFQTGGRNKRTGDKLRLTNSKGELINLVSSSETYDIHKMEVDRIRNFIQLLANYLDWKVIEKNWNWGQFKLKKFKKRDFNNIKKSLNNRTYLEMMKLNPFSYAMTSSINIEFTLEEN